MPLIIKVASIPKERIQVYFIDNEEYFKRKATYTDENGQLFDDNDERAIFFAKGVIETVKKLNWAPDIIHVHGWLASLLPLYLKQYYKDEPLFKESQVVTSIYSQSFDETLNAGMVEKIQFDEIEETHIDKLKTPNYSNLMKVAVDFSDGIIKGSQELPKDLEDYIDHCEKPVLDYQYPEAFTEAYTDFYNNEILN
jgi:starch synthase